MLKTFLAALAFGLALWLGAGLLIEGLFAPRPVRGERIEGGGRKMRLVCAGPADSERPTVWLEAGAFGFSADFGDLQAALAARGLRVCAYDRAGLGYSDPGPRPRDSQAVVDDAVRLMDAAGVTGPVILLGHSMGGQHVRLLATQHPDRVAGLVLVDATTPEAVEIPLVARFVRVFGRLSQAVAGANSVGLAKPLFFLGDRIGLADAGAVREKQAMFVSGRHARNAADEAAHWLDGAAHARAAGGLPPSLPVAVVTAGPAPENGAGVWAQAQAAPARASEAGAYAAVREAGHATILSHAHNAAIVAAVERVAAAAR